MDRIDGAGHIGRMFVSEDPATNRPPTEITDDWLNGVQEEIIGVIEAAGIALDKENKAQLLQAIGVLTNPVTAASDPTFANSSTKPASTGWVRGAMAAIANAAGFAMSLTTNGYIKMPSWLGGWCLSWITFTNPTANAYVSMTMPYTYTTSINAVFVSASGLNQFAVGNHVSGSTCQATTNQSGGAGTLFALGK